MTAMRVRPDGPVRPWTNFGSWCRNYVVDWRGRQYLVKVSWNAARRYPPLVYNLASRREMKPGSKTYARFAEELFQVLDDEDLEAAA